MFKKIYILVSIIQVISLLLLETKYYVILSAVVLFLLILLSINYLLSGGHLGLKVDSVVFRDYSYVIFLKTVFAVFGSIGLILVSCFSSLVIDYEKLIGYHFYYIVWFALFFVLFFVFDEVERSFVCKKITNVVVFLQYFVLIFSIFHTYGFLGEFFDNSGTVELFGIHFYRNTGLSLIESTALAYFVIIFYLAQSKVRCFAFGSYIDAIISIVVVVSTVSKPALVILGLLMVYYVAKASLLRIIAFSLSLSVTAIFFHETLYKFLASIFDYFLKASISSGSGRIDIWAKTLGLFEHVLIPFLGVGYRSPQVIGDGIGAHSYFIQTTVEFGVFSLLYMFINLYILWVGLRALNIEVIMRAIIISSVVFSFFFSEILNNKYAFFVIYFIIPIFICILKKNKERAAFDKFNSVGK
ncbi:hypothetical protein [Parendozoicomonas haliclonae]|uniref:O-Antigen ligase n=1 Tax=Parendozoicomonas haliclonae TaxID=1960125 RepID=A0A1X7ARE7_9GAMM|nr:hypothetical protein [Parendozoicomonas haliclonae]SMA50886.1 hypothetical protein EHSB41UT_04704 [Parendozoicomonas haliclonae]